MISNGAALILLLFAPLPGELEHELGQVEDQEAVGSEVVLIAATDFDLTARLVPLDDILQDVVED